MILKGSQRAGATQLANHLLKVEDNEHVEIHEISGFVSEDLHGALNEIYAVSKGTRCKQFMFSVSLNPPETESVPVQYFEKALSDIEKDLGLEGQPRVIIFHEKEGRRHAHVVWSRIDTDEMKAINLPYYKLKLRDISKQLYFQYGWPMPQGLVDGEERNPLNFSLAEWQQAKRLDEDPKVLKQLFQDCWAASDNRQAFEQILKNHGMYLARGDRRGFVAIDYRGEVFSLSRWTGVNTKDLKHRLGDPEFLRSTDEVKAHIATRMTAKLEQYIEHAQAQMHTKIKPYLQKKQTLIKKHRHERLALKLKQEDRSQRESVERSQRLPKGFKGIWYRLTGKYKKIREQNERETEQCLVRDREKKQRLIDRQLKERQRLQRQVRPVIENYRTEKANLKQDIARYMEMGPPSQSGLQKEFTRAQHPAYVPEPGFTRSRGR